MKVEELLPVRFEILQVIKDHKSVSFDFLHRRFFGLSSRLLRYHLKKLADLDFIIKRGITKGAVYEVK